MTAATFDPAAMTLAVAKALYVEMTREDTDPAPPWEKLDAGDQQGLTECAKAAVEAHAGWLQANGFRIVPPGAITAPQSLEEAQVMIAAAQQYMAQNGRKSLLGPMGQILAPSSKLSH